MTQTIAVIAQGAMGSGIARVLHEHGTKVLTLLEGRGPASPHRRLQTVIKGLDWINKGSLISRAGGAADRRQVPPGSAGVGDHLVEPWGVVAERSERRGGD